MYGHCESLFSQCSHSPCPLAISGKCFRKMLIRASSHLGTEVKTLKIHFCVENVFFCKFTMCINVTLCVEIILKMSGSSLLTNRPVVSPAKREKLIFICANLCSGHHESSVSCEPISHENRH